MSKEILARKLTAWYIDRRPQKVTIRDGHPSYRGWVCDFGFDLPNGERFGWKLNIRKELVGLIFLAAHWSLTGQYENGVATLAELCYQDLLDTNKWSSDQFKEQMIRDISNFREDINIHYDKQIQPRKSLSVRYDAFEGFHVISKNWKSIANVLNIEKILADDIPVLDVKQVYGIFSQLRYPDTINNGRRILFIKIPRAR